MSNETTITRETIRCTMNGVKMHDVVILGALLWWKVLCMVILIHYNIDNENKNYIRMIFLKLCLI